MSYSEYVKLKEENEEELARLYFFICERNKKERKEMEDSRPTTGGGEVINYAFVRKEDYNNGEEI